MSRPRLAVPTAALLVVTLGLTACDQATTSPDVEIAPSYAKTAEQASSFQADAVTSLTQMVDDFNAQLAAKGSRLRLDYPWLFTTGTGNDSIGSGTDPYARLRTGARWMTEDPTYLIDASDYPAYPAAADVEAALVAAYDSWNAVANTSLEAHRVSDPGTNVDYLDGTYLSGECVGIVDVDFDPSVSTADIVVGGWLPETYFSDCLGSPDIIAVTWTFILVDELGRPVDTNHDQYFDRVYVEQYFNAGLPWVTQGSQYLHYAYGFDVQSIAVHEDGHAHGLGHFGGPVRKQPFKLQPNLKVFNPEAVMNPVYLGGEKRTPYATDVGGMRTMYAR